MHLFTRFRRDGRCTMRSFYDPSPTARNATVRVHRHSNSRNRLKVPGLPTTAQVSHPNLEAATILFRRHHRFAAELARERAGVDVANPPRPASPGNSGIYRGANRRRDHSGLLLVVGGLPSFACPDGALVAGFRRSGTECSADGRLFHPNNPLTFLGGSLAGH